MTILDVVNWRTVRSPVRPITLIKHIVVTIVPPMVSRTSGSICITTLKLPLLNQAVPLFLPAIEREVPRRLLVRKATPVYPLILFELVVTPVVLIDVASLGLRVIQAIEAEPVEVPSNAGRNPRDNAFVVLSALAAGTRRCFVRELGKVLKNVIDGVPEKDGLERPDIDRVQVLLIVKQGSLLAGTVGVK